MSDVHRSEMSLASAYARILSALESGRDVLAMPPVGQLRLDCYRQLVKQLPGIILIISSFKERMEKEISMLEQDSIPAAMLHSGTTDYVMAAQRERVRRHHFRILFVSPGLLEKSEIRSFLVSQASISLIVIDEAQICSIHAPHFQPLYYAIPLLLKDLERQAAGRQASGNLHMLCREAASGGASIEGSRATAASGAVHIEASDRQRSTRPARPPVLALALPTTRQVEQDIGHFFSLQHPLLIRHQFERLNLFLSVHRPQRKAPFLLDFLRRHEDEAGIIYCTEHRLTEHIAQLLNRSGFPALSYHAGLTREERMANLRAFCAGARSAEHPKAAAQVAGCRSDARMKARRMQGPAGPGAQGNAGARILVVTPDPFLELDRSDVRFVLHYTMPESLDHYYQEVVHAGCDGLPAECILLANERDLELQRTKLGKVTLGYQAYPEVVAQVKRRFEAMRRYAMTHQCLRAFMKNYVEQADETSTSSAPGNVFIATQLDSSAQTAEHHLNRTSVNGKMQTSADYEVLTLPSRNRVLTSAELPVDESLRTIRQSGRYPVNRVEKVSMQLERAEKHHIFIRYADREHMRNQAYKYDHLRMDPWELCEPGIRVQNFRAFTIPRDSCCVNCNPEHFLEEDRYGISDTMGLQERMREHLHQLETDMDVGRKIRLWKAGEKQHHFDYDAHARGTGRIMAMRKVEYQKTATARILDGEADAQQLRLLESARLEISPEMRTQLLGNLKALRKRLAMERNVQAYQIFTDKSLVEMCRMLPLTREEFARIHGVGQRKLELHYEAFTDEIRKALDPARVADFYENVSEEIQEDLQYGTGTCATVGFAADPGHVAGFCENELGKRQDSTEACAAMGFAADPGQQENSTRAGLTDAGVPATVIKPVPKARSESQQKPKYRFIPDDVLLAFLEEKYLQQRTRKQVKKKQDFFLTVAEAASFHCSDGLRSTEIAALLNALVEEAEQQEQERKKLSGATIDRKLAELGYLELSEYRINGRPRQAYLPTTKGKTAGIALGTRTSQGGVDYPTAYFNAAAAGWVATLFVREEQT